MSETEYFSISLDKELLPDIEFLKKKMKAKSRPEVIRRLIIEKVQEYNKQELEVPA